MPQMQSTEYRRKHTSYFCCMTLPCSLYWSFKRGQWNSIKILSRLSCFFFYSSCKYKFILLVLGKETFLRLMVLKPERINISGFKLKIIASFNWIAVLINFKYNFLAFVFNLKTVLIFICFLIGIHYSLSQT